MGATKLSKPEVDAILKSGAFYRLDHYALCQELNEKVTAAFLEGIGSLAGSECRERVAADGLRNLHLHFPITKIHLLEAHLMRRLRDELYYWSYRVGADNLGLTDPFYVDHLIVFRIHYPFLLARGAKDIEQAPVLWGERMRLAMAALRDWKSLGDYLGNRSEKGKSEPGQGEMHDPYAYHGAIPIPARSHGPHIDTWYGHSFDGINLWLSIDGVNEDNTVILYPEMFARPLAFDPVSMYIARGIELTKPQKIDLKPGELLVFNPEMLHGTQVNISAETRVALTTRINPAQPRFHSNAPFYMEHWYSSEDLRQRTFTHVKHFAHARFQGAPSIVPGERYADPRTIRVSKHEAFPATGKCAVVDAARLLQGVKLAVDFPNAKLLLWRDGDQLRAYDRRCPHLGIDIADGFHDTNRIYCPGHGIAFSLADGHSKCESFKLLRYEVFEEGGVVFVERLSRSDDGAATASPVAAERATMSSEPQ